MSAPQSITVQSVIQAPIERVWECWTEPVHITKWNQASEDWHTPRATNDLREGEKFTARMEAKDGSMGFDFGGTYTKVIPQKHIAYTMDGDGRTVTVDFEERGDSVYITETFDAENENPIDMQRDGWQAILNNFKKYAEAH
jgi:uncharacterized protein YndB with AHSA1/START domain